MSIEGKYVMHVTVIDPDSGAPVDVDIYKLDTGAMVGVDSSFIEQEVGEIYSPYDNGVELNLE